MKLFTVLVLMFAAVSSHAALEDTVVFRGKRLQSVLCLMSSSEPLDLKGRYDDISVNRVTTGGDIKYEIYNQANGDLVAACDGFLIK
jgi:hypothetical protein